MTDSVEELKEAFQLFDRDQDGKVSVEELGTILRAVGLNPTQAEIRDIAKKLGGSTGLISFQDIQNTVQQQRQKSGKGSPENAAEEQTREAFKVFDKNGTGFIEVAELRHVLTTLGEKLTTQEVDVVMKEADLDADGKISLQDFLRVIKSSKP